MGSSMKIGLYSPYLPKHFGGGEKYILDVARCLVSDGHKVTIGLSGPVVSDEQLTAKIKEYEVFLGESLAGIQWVPAPMNAGDSWLSKLSWTKQFDVVYYLTDGSMWWSAAKRNVMHIQFPFSKPLSMSQRLKLFNWPIRNTNSVFTRRVVSRAWHTPIQFVHYPMVVPPLEVGATIRKEKVILSVGRFFKHLHSKRQDVLVSMFAELLKTEPKLLAGWKLVLIGAVEDEQYAAAVKGAAKGLPIEFYHSLSKSEVWQWYAKAKIYWHAAGWEVDETTEPMKVEHFGISTVEAMSMGAVPVVHGKGGQPEVVGDALKMWLWQTPTDGMRKTLDLIKNPDQVAAASHQAQKQAASFGEAAFKATLRQMIGDQHANT